MFNFIAEDRQILKNFLISSLYCNQINVQTNELLHEEKYIAINKNNINGILCHEDEKPTNG